MGDRAVRGLLIAAATLCLVAGPSSRPALAVWSDQADLIYDTAFTLDQGEFEVGVFSPLIYGVNDRVQLSMHPILFLILSPHAGLKWQVTPTGPWALSLSVEGAWSFLEPVDEAGREVLDDDACDGCGFPGSLHAWPTLSWEVRPGLLLSGGAGPRFDFLSWRHADTALVTHGSLQWIVDPENLLMVHGTFDTRPWETSEVSDTVVQLTYSHAWGVLHLAIGLAVGRFELIFKQGSVATVAGQRETQEGEVHAWPVFPVVDLFLRL